MRILQRIWEDVRQGENIDLYLTVAVAIALVIMSILGIAPGSWLPPITLAVLALLAVSNLGNRHKLESVLRKHSAESLLLGEYPPGFHKDINSAKELWIMGLNLARTVPNLYPDLEAKIVKGDKVRILVVDPDGIANKVIVTRFYWPADERQYRDKIRSTLSSLVHLARIAPDRFEVRILDYPLAFGVFAANLDSPNGVIYMEQYGFKMKRDNVPKLVLKPKDGHWYEHYREQVLALWENAVPWDYSGENNGQQ